MIKILSDKVETPGWLLWAALVVIVASIAVVTLAANRANDAERESERLRLVAAGLTVDLETSHKEMKAVADAALIGPIAQLVPGPIRVVEVVKWQTKEVPVEVTRTQIKEIFGLTDCTDLVFHDGVAETPVEDDDPVVGHVTGEIVKVRTEKGNTIINGKATAWFEDTLLFSSDFDWDATTSMSEYRKQIAKRWWVGVDYGFILKDSSYYDYDLDQDISVQPEAVCVNGGRVLFPLKPISLGVGGAACADRVAVSGKIWF